MASSMDPMQNAYIWQPNNWNSMNYSTNRERKQSLPEPSLSSRARPAPSAAFGPLPSENGRNNPWSTLPNTQNSTPALSFRQPNFTHSNSPINAAQEFSRPFTSMSNSDQDNRSAAWNARVGTSSVGTSIRTLPSSQTWASSRNTSLPPSRDGFETVPNVTTFKNPFTSSFTTSRPISREGRMRNNSWEEQIATLTLGSLDHSGAPERMFPHPGKENAHISNWLSEDSMYPAAGPITDPSHIWGMRRDSNLSFSVPETPPISYASAFGTPQQTPAAMKSIIGSKNTTPLGHGRYNQHSISSGGAFGDRPGRGTISAVGSKPPSPGSGSTSSSSHYTHGASFSNHNLQNLKIQPPKGPAAANFGSFNPLRTLPNGTTSFAPSTGLYPSPTQTVPLRSPRLEQFLTTPKPQRHRWTIKDIFDYAHEFSTNQEGSRFVQERLDVASSDEKERIFCELEREALTLMKDVFGNYVMQKYFDMGTQEQRTRLVEKMRGRVLQLSKQQYGCRVVQKALDHIFLGQKVELLEELRDHVLECVQDQNGNHVIQKAIQSVPQEYIPFIFAPFQGQVARWAVHSYGCRVVQRMLEHCEAEQRAAVLRELHSCIPALIDNSMGNYVAQHLIESGSLEDRAIFMEHVRMDFPRYARNKHASNVVEKCLKFGSDEQRRGIMLRAIEKGPRGDNMLPCLIRDSYGNYVIQQLLDTLRSPDFEIFVDCLRPEVVKAKKQATLVKQLQKIEEKMRRRDQMAAAAAAGAPPPSTQSSIEAATPPLISDGRTPTTGSRPSTASTSMPDGLPVPSSATARGGLALVKGPESIYLSSA